MPTYLYETIPETPEEKPILFEIRQSMRDPAMTHHPENGKRMRRVITGGLGFLGASSHSQSSQRGAMGCGCHPS